MTAIAQWLTQALQHHQAGNLGLAEQFFRQVLQIDPSHAGALNSLAVVLAQEGRLVDAVVCFEQALQLHPGDLAMRNNLGLILYRQGNLDAAITHYQHVLRLNPDYVETHFNMGNALRNRGNMSEAIACYRQALRRQPDHVWALNNLGALLIDQGELDEAMSYLQQALRLQPNLAETNNNLGNALARIDRLQEACSFFHRALQFNPNFAEAWYNLGNTLKRLDKLEEAISHFRQALRCKPNFAKACNNLGSALTQQDKLEEGIGWYREALRLRPDYAAAHYNLANALADQDKLDEAVHSYRQSLQLQPNYAKAYTNLGNLYQQRGQLEEALTCYDQALRQDPDHAETHFNRALLWLLMGDWTKGWSEYDWRFRIKDFPPHSFTQPRWDGGPLAGRTLLVLAEQGLGDTIHFLRFVLLARQCGGRVILQCQPQLLPLLAECLGEQELIVQGKPLPAFDVYAPLVSMPGILGHLPTTIPAAVPYLHASPERVEHWKKELEPIQGFRIGIAWQGTPKFRGDRLRSIPLPQFAGLAKVPGIQLISLQKGPGTDQLQALAGKIPVIDLGSGLDEASGAFVDTAAVMMNLDLVVSSDTAVPHLAGALGVPVWLALALVPDWRWLLEREDTPWYPTMRLFRQTRYGRWDDVFARIADELQTLVAKRS
jgi:tetratricopeptide (TPR) repeat protein